MGNFGTHILLEKRRGHLLLSSWLLCSSFADNWQCPLIFRNLGRDDEGSYLCKAVQNVVSEEGVIKYSDFKDFVINLKIERKFASPINEMWDNILSAPALLGGNHLLVKSLNFEIKLFDYSIIQFKFHPIAMKVMKKLSTFNVIHYINPVILLKWHLLHNFLHLKRII